MNTWIVGEDLMKHHCLIKKAFYSSLNMKDITDIDHRHAKRVFKILNNKNLGDYHDLYIRSDTLLLADVFEHFRNMCIKLYELDPAHFYCPRIGMARMFKENRGRIRIVNCWFYVVNGRKRN